MDQTPTPAPRPRARPPFWLKLFYVAPLIFVAGLCGYMFYGHVTHRGPPVRPISSQPFSTVKIGAVNASLFTSGDQLRAAGNDLFLQFRNPSGQMVDVGNVTFALELKMPEAVMHTMGKVFRTATPGEYRTTVEPQVGGDWIAELAVSGPEGNASTNFPVSVK